MHGHALWLILTLMPKKAKYGEAKEKWIDHGRWGKILSSIEFREYVLVLVAFK